MNTTEILTCPRHYQMLPAERLEDEDSDNDEEGEDEGAVRGDLLAGRQSLLHPLETWFQPSCCTLTTLRRPSCLPPVPSLSPFIASSLTE